MTPFSANPFTTTTSNHLCGPRRHAVAFSFRPFRGEVWRRSGMDRVDGILPSGDVVSFDAVSLCSSLSALSLASRWSCSTAILCGMPSVVTSKHVKRVRTTARTGIDGATCVSVGFTFILAWSSCTRMTRHGTETRNPPSSAPTGLPWTSQLSSAQMELVSSAQPCWPTTLEVLREWVASVGQQQSGAISEAVRDPHVQRRSIRLHMSW